MSLFAVLIGMFLGGSAPPRPETVAAAPAANSTEKPAAPVPQESPATAEDFTKHVQPFIEKYCFTCHADGLEEGGIALDSATHADAITKDRRTWERTLRMVRMKAMPPGDTDPLPTDEERERVVEWLDAKLYFVDCNMPPDPGRVTIRRLNRAEYNNTIRDLIGLDFQPAEDFPSDEVGEGFDNIGDVLSLPPLLFEKYVAAAEEISQRAIVGKPHEQLARRVESGNLKKSGSAGDVDNAGFVWMSSTGSVFTELDFPSAGTYSVEVEVSADQAGPEKAKVELRLDGKPVKTFATKQSRRPESYSTTIRVDSGQHKIEAAFINDYYNPEAKDRRQRDRNLGVRSILVKGPSDFDPAALPETHQRIVFVRPQENESIRPTAEQVLKKFLPRAFRRPVDEAEVGRFVDLVEFATGRGDTFEQGIQLAVQAALVSPHFLYRVESDPDPDDPQAAHRLADFELASRLSYFLWSTMPDEELFRSAERNELHQPDVVRRQVKRMLADPKSQALVDNFATQWLNLRLLEEIVPDPDSFPKFDDQLRKDMQAETQLFFEAVMREDRSILEFLDGNFTFVNERLAKHYGIGGVDGNEFRKVSLTGLPRRGVLTQASILTLTSNPMRTSPVKRGKWILENILDTPPPPPPPDVPELEATAEKAPQGASLREQLEIHRKDPGCAACHVEMDQLGFGFENFDAVGRWRDKHDQIAIDASGDLPGSGKFNGPVELIGLLKEREDEFRRCLVKKMLTYALGRGLEYYDKCAIDEITLNLKASDDRFSVLMTEIALSKPFLQRRGDAPTK